MGGFWDHDIRINSTNSEWTLKWKFQTQSTMVDVSLWSDFQILLFFLFFWAHECLPEQNFWKSFLCNLNIMGPMVNIFLVTSPFIFSKPHRVTIIFSISSLSRWEIVSKELRIGTQFHTRTLAWLSCLFLLLKGSHFVKNFWERALWNGPPVVMFWQQNWWEAITQYSRVRKS